MSEQSPVNEPQPQQAERRMRGKQPAALKLLQYEAEIRRQKNEKELIHHLLHMTTTLCTYEQSMLLRKNRNTGRYEVTQAGNVVGVERDAPLVSLYEGEINRLFSVSEASIETQPTAAEGDASKDDHSVATTKRAATNAVPDAVELSPLADGSDPLLAAATGYGYALALRDSDDAVSAVVLFLRSTPFSEGERLLLLRLADTYAHAWRGLGKQRQFDIRRGIPRRRLGLVVGVLLLIGLIPVPHSVLAPVEVVAEAPYVVSSPINGVVRRINVVPNGKVTVGDEVLEFEDVQVRNDMEIAKQKIDVAQAREVRTVAAAFRDTQAAHEMAIAKAEYELAVVNYDYASELFERTRVKADIAGVAIYSDKRDIEGRLFSVGEEVMLIADPNRIRYRIEVPVDSVIRIESGAEVSVYLKDSPLGGNLARMESMSYKPKELPSGQLGYIVYADRNDADLPAIGSRGVARITGGRQPLIWSLLSRPVSVVRQTVGL